MLARRSRIEFPDGTVVTTPLIVPSFSSRGFGFDRGKSKVGEALEYSEAWLSDLGLISAYDIAYGHLPKTSGLGRFPARLPYSAPKAWIIDSGTYEARAELDPTQGRLIIANRKPWNLQLLQRCLDDKVDARLPIVIVNFDRPGAIHDQIVSATRLFSRYPSFLRDFLIKPGRREPYVLADEVVAVGAELAQFNVIGMTEKELGGSLIERMETIARIRSGLDALGVSAPIHIFGSLDPLLSTLYFISGAEIFDGLTWLYLAGQQDLWIYADQQTALDHNWLQDEYQRWATRLQRNLTMMGNLQAMLARFVATGGSWPVLATHQDAAENAFGNLVARLGVA